ncbi:MAG: hypothetical protein QG595_1805 [Pseudomonadota bacterium]|jgi:peptidoglycan/xylan/chitin deacetylase (PgdA/CDA1 family)|nr:hypothetical protein [Pseudomonadota bacterium]
MLHTRIKQALRRSLGHTAPLAVRLRARPSLLILTYHRVLPATHPARRTEQPGMYVSPDTLALHLQVLRRHFAIIDLGVWLKRRREGAALPARACCITFDDGWQDNYTYGFPVLAAAQVPATIFLVADFIGSRYRFWPNRLAQLLGVLDADHLADLPDELSAVLAAAGFVAGVPGGMVDIGRIDAVINAAKSLSDETLVQLLDTAEARLGVAADAQSRDLLNADEIMTMRDSGLVAFGSHSRRHQRLLAGINPATLDDELLQSRAIIERVVERPVELFCYPNGDWSVAALALVRRAYLAAVTTVPGWNQPQSDLHLLRRMSVHEDVGADEASFMARVAGLV